MHASYQIEGDPYSYSEVSDYLYIYVKDYCPREKYYIDNTAPYFTSVLTDITIIAETELNY